MTGFAGVLPKDSKDTYVVGKSPLFRMDQDGLGLNTFKMPGMFNKKSYSKKTTQNIWSNQHRLNLIS